MTDLRTPGAAGVRDAAERIGRAAVRTPLLENAALNERTGGRILLKAETLQHGGSFKFRGAFNRLSCLTQDERRRGVLAWSSGNHGLGIALAARQFSAPAVIVMPSDAPKVKADQVRALGAKIIPYDRASEDREEIGRRIAAEHGLALAPSYDHPDVIEGQGTLALEAAEQAQAMGATIDGFVICCGGGGLASGCALILEEISPYTAIHIAEPEGYAETWASIEAGRRLKNDVTRKTICDAIATPTPGALTYPILRRRVASGAAVTEDEVLDAMAFAFKHLKLVVEPGGAAALAAVLGGKTPARGKTVAVTLSGGNVDPAVFQAALARLG